MYSAPVVILDATIAVVLVRLKVFRDRGSDGSHYFAKLQQYQFITNGEKPHMQNPAMFEEELQLHSMGACNRLGLPIIGMRLATEMTS